MVSLLEIGPMRETVSIRGKDITVSGITAQGLFDLMTTFPELQKAFAGQQLDGDALQVMITRLGHTIGQVIAMGVGMPGDSETIGFAMTQLSVGEQLDLLKPIMRLTFPQGIKSFVDDLTAAADSAGVRGKGPLMRSQEQSSVSSPTVTTSETAGTTLQDSSQAGAS